MPRSNPENDEEALIAGNVSRRPDPDPTARTLVLVDKAIAALREELKIRFESVDTRFASMEKATQLVHDDYVRVPTVVDKAINALREVFETRVGCLEDSVVRLRTYSEVRPEAIEVASNQLQTLMDQKIATAFERLSGRLEQYIGETGERFTGVAAQFSERDTRTDQRAGDTKLAVDAAFAAAKEATSKIELGFTKQIDSMVLAMDTLTKNVEGKISDVKDMINDVKGRITAVETRTVANKDMTGWAFGGLMFVIAAITLVVMIVRHV